MNDEELVEHMCRADKGPLWDSGAWLQDQVRRRMRTVLALVREHDAAQFATAREQAKLEGELAGLSQAFAVVSAHGRRWLAERYKDTQARIAALTTPIPVNGCEEGAVKHGS